MCPWRGEWSPAQSPPHTASALQRLAGGTGLGLAGAGTQRGPEVRGLWEGPQLHRKLLEQFRLAQVFSDPAVPRQALSCASQFDGQTQARNCAHTQVWPLSALSPEVVGRALAQPGDRLMVA